VSATPPAGKARSTTASNAAASVSQPAADPATASLSENASPEPGDLDPDPAPEDGAGETLYLTIVGDQTYVSRGRVGDGPPSVAQLQSGVSAGGGAALVAAVARPAAGSTAAPVPRSSRVPATSRTSTIAQRAATRTAAGQPSANPTGSNAAPENGSQPPNPPAENTAPWVDDRPWPQAGCPWTLPEATSQAQADTLRAQYGCRYLASCSFATQQCTFFYQGAS